MPRTPLELLVENLDRRLSRIEQILPTLATREEMRCAVADAVAPLATREEMRRAIADAVAPLATRQEMHHAIAEAVAPLATREEMQLAAAETRRHFDVVAESLRDDIRIVAEGVATLAQRFDRGSGF